MLCFENANRLNFLVIWINSPKYHVARPIGMTNFAGDVTNLQRDWKIIDWQKEPHWELLVRWRIRKLVLINCFQFWQTVMLQWQEKNRRTDYLASEFYFGEGGTSHDCEHQGKHLSVASDWFSAGVRVTRNAAWSLMSSWKRTHVNLLAPCDEIENPCRVLKAPLLTLSPLVTRSAENVSRDAPKHRHRVWVKLNTHAEHFVITVWAARNLGTFGTDRAEMITSDPCCRTLLP